ncbi:hypothetical protein HPG69_003460, partial [Diceros bicornis minor]
KRKYFLHANNQQYLVEWSDLELHSNNLSHHVEYPCGRKKQVPYQIDMVMRFLKLIIVLNKGQWWNIVTKVIFKWMKHLGFFRYELERNVSKDMIRENLFKTVMMPRSSYMDQKVQHHLCVRPESCQILECSNYFLVSSHTFGPSMQLWPTSHSTVPPNSLVSSFTIVEKGYYESLAKVKPGNFHIMPSREPTS